MKNWGAIGAVVFAGVLAYVVGVRLGESAMAVIIGVIFGVAASVPVSIILALMLRRADAERVSPAPPDYHQPMIIVPPPTTPPGSSIPWNAGSPQGFYLPPLSSGEAQEGQTRREFRVVGE